MLVDYPPPTFSNADPFEIAVELSDAINTQVVGSHYASVTLVGYCMGPCWCARPSSTDATRPTTTRSGTLKRRKGRGRAGRPIRPHSRAESWLQPGAGENGPTHAP